MIERHSSLCIVFLTLAALVLGCSKTEEELRVEAAKRERGGKFAAARVDLAKRPGKTQLVEQPSIVGKVAMLESTDGAEHHYAYFPPPEFAKLEAMTPDEVGTVVLKTCRSIQKGVYRTAENVPREVPAIAIDCDVSLIDRQADTLYFVKRFEGKLSGTASIAETSNRVSSGPTDEINRFLGALPRR